MPFLALLDEKVRQGVSVRLLHAKEPGGNFCNDFDSYLALLLGLERALCPRARRKFMEHPEIKELCYEIFGNVA